MKKVLILGMGISGRAAAEFLISRGESVIGIDKNSDLLVNHPGIQQLRGKGMEVFEESAFIDLSSVKLIIISPGVASHHRLYQMALEKGIEVIGEAELAFRYAKQKCLGITGTNGKTTVTLLTEHVLNTCGIKAKALGNVGDPLSSHFLHLDPSTIVVAELSSYQLETMSARVFDAAIILNITPDHLDRYPTMEDYARAKLRLEHCMKKTGILYVHTDVVKEFGPLFASASFKTYGHSPGSFFWTDQCLAKCEEKVEYILPLRYRKMGMHECENILAAWVLTRDFCISEAQFCKAIETFKRPPHRIEFLTSIEGVAYFDDSKGTNLDAVIQAVRAMPGPVILIVGGVDKGASYLPWVTHFEKRVKRIIAMGQAAEKIYRELNNFFSLTIVNSLEEAVHLAEACAVAGDCVLLSPGCSSFDMFRDYAHRGDEFKRFVHYLEERRKK